MARLVPADIDELRDCGIEIRVKIEAHGERLRSERAACFLQQREIGEQRFRADQRAMQREIERIRVGFADALHYVADDLAQIRLGGAAWWTTDEARADDNKKPSPDLAQKQLEAPAQQVSSGNATP